MFCSQCGSQVADGQAFCSSCGASTGAATQQAHPQYQQTQSYQQTQYQQTQSYQQAQYSYAAPNQMPMNWYKFLIYFSLIAGAVLNAISGIMYLTGSIYTMQGSSADLVYWIFGDLKTIDMIYGLAAIAIAVFGILTWVSLKNYRANGPKMLITLYIVSSAIGILYSVIVLGIIGEALTESLAASQIASIFTALITGILMSVINHIYFKKRAHLFVN